MGDKTQYEYNGTVYGKGRLVLAVFGSQIQRPNETFQNLKSNLDSIPFNSQIVIDLEEYQRKYAVSDDIQKRYFINEPLVDTEGLSFYVSSQWGLGNIDGFISKARELGHTIRIIRDQGSELSRRYEQYKQEPRERWMREFSARCEPLRAQNVDSIDFSSEEFLDTYWRQGANGVCSVKPGMLSNEEFSAVKVDLPEISRKILLNPTPEMLDEVMAWADEAKAEGRLQSIKKGVIHRFFCACSPGNLSTIVSYGSLVKFVKAWNSSGWGPSIEISGNWVDLNNRLMATVRMRGFEDEDKYLVNTFVWRLKTQLLDESPSPTPKPPAISDPASPRLPQAAEVGALNQILYGPPGTGKTYNTVEAAVRIADRAFSESLAQEPLTDQDRRARLKIRFDELIESGQIAFTTFHQSFTYEDFVEGIKAESADGNIEYVIEDGIFKKICDSAAPSARKVSVDTAISDFQEKCAEEPVTMATATGKRFSVTYAGGKTFSCLPEASTTQNPLPANIDYIRQFSLGELPENVYCPSYVKAISKYLIETYGISQEGSAAQQSAQPHVLIIDEINRGNIAKIFGELITLLEPDKRQGQSDQITITLPYSKKPFSVPSNVYVIGTMNTADTSLARLDIALRRRFEFIEMMPSPELLSDVVIEGVEVSKLLETINQRIELVYDRDHMIGHSYFMHLGSESEISELAEVFRKQVLPLLEEYFFEDWETIHQVLGDNQKKDKNLRFIRERYTDNDLSHLLGADWQSNSNLQAAWEVNEAALTNAFAYIATYAPNSVVEEALDQESST
jgi:5-methylcytosine-specific restriction enzyme B